MTATTNGLQRQEMKYLLEERQYHALRGAMEYRMAEDGCGRQEVCEMYFDAEDSALRLRSFGVPSMDSTVFADAEWTVDGELRQRRARMTLSEAYRCLLAGIHPAQETQALREISGMLQGRHLRPRMVVAFDRLALAGVAEPGLHVTLDTRVRRRTDRLDLLLGSDGKPLTAPGTVLMGIQTQGALPAWLGRVLTEHQIRPIGIPLSPAGGTIVCA